MKSLSLVELEQRISELERVQRQIKWVQVVIAASVGWLLGMAT